jgi:hypothetical protein
LWSSLGVDIFVHIIDFCRCVKGGGPPSFKN